MTTIPTWVLYVPFGLIIAAGLVGYIAGRLDGTRKYHNLIKRDREDQAYFAKRKLRPDAAFHGDV